MSKRKLLSLQKKLDKFKNKKKLLVPSKGCNKNPCDIAIEMVAGAVTGVIVGMMLDSFFKTKPVFLIICIMMGVLVVLRSIWNNNIK